MKAKTLMTLLSVALVASAAACGPTNDGPRVDRTPAPMRNFHTDREFNQYMEALAAEAEQARSNYDDGLYADASVPMADEGGEPANEGITNNQEEGVDEGGIVKNIGDHLVILRQGRLYSVLTAESGETAQADSIRVAPNEELNSGVWYDEMLVRGSRIYVIGYRYVANVLSEDGENLPWIFGATEVSSFSMDQNGELTRGGTTFIESNDYYSGANYASRLVDGKLIFYMPYYAFIRHDNTTLPRIPRILAHHEGRNFRSQRPMFSPTDVIRPMVAPQHPTFHTVVQCELPDDLSIDCSAKSLLAEPSWEFYVSRENIYLWTGDYVYAISQVKATVRAHSAVGYPRDQFAFREVDGTLHVAVTVRDDEDDYRSPQSLKMLSLPLNAFDARGEQFLDRRTRLIAEDIQNSWSMRSRHVADWYLAGLDGKLHAFRLDSGLTRTFELDGNASRIESAPGIGAVIARHQGSDLVLESLLLGADARLGGGAILENMGEGESRSHGFFFKPDADGGVFGLPVIGRSGDYGHWWGSGISNIAFFRVGTDGDIAFRGAVSSSPEAEGECETSCVDWYGNTRPIFLRDRIYALMGAEIVEVALGDEEIESVGASVILSR
ncbi:MAG: beta-propeller domain-containing protein [Bradymonadaceae bacterium]